MQPLGDITFDHVITWWVKSVILQLSRKLGWNTYVKKMVLLSVTWFILARFLYFYMSFLYFTWSRNLLKLHSATSRKVITTKLGGNTYKNEIVAYLHMMWPNHAKLIKTTSLKVALMKGIHLSRPRDFWLYYMLRNEKTIWNFYKSC